MIDGLKISIPQRIILLRVTLTLSLIISVFMSLNLWAGYRDFPYAPVYRLDIIPVQFDFVFIGLALLFWLCSLFLRQQRLFIFLAFVVCVYLSLMDVNRLQPWFYIYNSLLIIFIFYNGRVDDPNKFTSIFIILQLIFASVYFYTGISQLNAGFINSVFPEIISPLKHLMSERQFLFFIKMGHIVPYAMIFIGLGFTISPLRYLAITLAIFIHVLLLIFLFPSATNSNYALWFSNLSFLIMTLLLFSGKTKQRYFSPTFLFKMPLFYLVSFIFLVMPAFNYLNKWPDFLSSNFESGNSNSVVITLTKETRDKLPLYEKHFCEQRGSLIIINYEAWCKHELHASCFPDPLAFNSIYGHLQKLTGASVKDLQLHRVSRQKILVKP